MRNTTFAALAAFFLSACAGGQSRLGPDAYGGFAEMAAAHPEGRDYSVEAYDRGSRVTVLVPHGGDLERGASRVARHIAGADWNLYIFNAWLGRDSGRLHVTSARFDDPRAAELAGKADLAVSVHGQAAKGEWVCVGGANEAAGRLVAEALAEAGYRAGTPCRRLPGRSEKNIVNRAAAGGVQLEITLSLLGKLDKGGEDLPKFTLAVREGLSAALKDIKEKAR
ncbi:MAG: poly-gamma-glutamate hydrolase family protein [Elusimicrobiales bacterium]|nr:poly-gamma-glutamate hydrolase family protein [Elusimicrobiales bacterium]